MKQISWGCSEVLLVQNTEFTNKTERANTPAICRARRGELSEASRDLFCCRVHICCLDSKKKSHKNVILANLIHIQRWFEMRLKSDFY